MVDDIELEQKKERVRGCSSIKLKLGTTAIKNLLGNLNIKELLGTCSVNDRGFFSIFYSFEQTIIDKNYCLILNIYLLPNYKWSNI